MPAERWPVAPGSMIFFDVGDTLIEVSPSVGTIYAQACRTRGAEIDPAALQRAFDQAWARLSKEVPPGLDRYRFFPDGEQGWWRRICALAFDECGVPPVARPDVEELREIFTRASSWRIYPEAREVLGELRDHGYRLGVISNWDSRLETLLSTLGLDHYFEVVVSSARAGCEKPSAAIFHRALRQAAVTPSSAVHIGDRPEEDYEAARSCGLRALLLRRDRDPSEDEEHVVPDLLEALRRIRR